MANIVTVAVPAFIEESSEYDTQYKRTMKWNPEKGDFVMKACKPGCGVYRRRGLHDLVHESIYDRTIFLPCIFQRYRC